MMIIDTELKSSPIHGLGVFTKVAVKAGEAVWEHRPELSVFLHEDDWDDPEIPDALRDIFNINAWPSYEDNELWVLDIDYGRWMNHSENPTVVHDHDQKNYVAVRDLPAGTELTYNYIEDEGSLDFEPTKLSSK